MRRVWLGLVVWVLAACGSNAGGEPTTTTDSSTSTTVVETTTTVVEATTTTMAEEVEICRRGEVWEPGTIYVAECFFVPVAFEAAEEGWGSLGGGEDWLKVRWRDPSDGFRVRVALIAFRSSDTPIEILDRIAARELMSEVSERTEVFVGGASGLVVDVEGEPEPGGEVVSRDGTPCSADRPVWFPRTFFGHPLFEGAGQDMVGVGACHVVRIWAVQAGDLTVTIVGGTTDPEHHEEAVAKIEELFKGVSFSEP